MHIVHLEDDGPLRDILGTALTTVDPSCTLHQFIDSDSALKHIEQHGQQVDLFILDIRVPGSMNGLQVAEKIRALDCPGAIVITSAFRVPSREQLEKLRAEWFPKPWHITETIQKLFRLARTSKQKNQDDENAQDAAGKNGSAQPAAPPPKKEGEQAAMPKPREQSINPGNAGDVK